MKSNKICFNKSAGIVGLVLVSVSIFTFFVFQLTKKPTSTSARASAPTKNIQPSSSLPIIGGELAKDGEFPFMAALFHKDEFKIEANKSLKTGNSVIKHNLYDSTFCGGALISPQWVITAAHCVDDIEKDPEKVGIALNFINLKDTSLSNKIIVGVNQIYIYDDYWGADGLNTVNDIALLRLDRRLDSAFIPWSNNKTLISPNKKGMAIGWGCTIISVQCSISEKLKKVEANIALFEPHTGWVHEKVFLGSKNGAQITAAGDSGGPFIVEDKNKYYLVGIVNGVDDIYKPVRIHGTRFTDVTQFSQWISSIITTHSSSQ